MSSNNSITAPYLRTTRNFPEDSAKLSDEMDKAYIDTANAVNARTIGIFPTRRPIVTGESWFIDNNNKQQTIRQIYRFDAIAAGATLDIPTGIFNFTEFTRIYGEVVTAIPDYRPIPYADAAVVTNQISIRVVFIGTDSFIRIVVGATSPALVRGLAVLEWLSER